MPKKKAPKLKLKNFFVSASLKIRAADEEAAETMANLLLDSLKEKEPALLEVNTWDTEYSAEDDDDDDGV